jgi:hypothetical protein
MNPKGVARRYLPRGIVAFDAIGEFRNLVERHLVHTLDAEVGAEHFVENVDDASRHDPIVASRPDVAICKPEWNTAADQVAS